MSNEELAAEIQAGHMERLGELWEQIEGLVKWKAQRIVTALELRGRSCGVEYDDLVQCGYLALAAAVETYKPENGAFSTWFMFYLKAEFAKVTGTRTNRSDNEPLNTAESLDAPMGDDSDSAAMWEVIPDPSGMAGLEKVEKEQYLEQLHNAVEAAMGELPEDLAEVLRLKYLDGQTLTEIGRRQGVSIDRVRNKRNQALRLMRRPKCSRYIKSFAQFDFYNGTGLGSFRNSGTTIQERYLLLEEEYQQREERRYQERVRRRQERKEREFMADLMAETKATAAERVANMTQEEKAALLAKYGCV